MMWVPLVVLALVSLFLVAFGARGVARRRIEVRTGVLVGARAVAAGLAFAAVGVAMGAVAVWIAITL